MAGLTDNDPLIAGVELGGTKCIATLARGRTILHQSRWPTQGPETLDHIAAALDRWHAQTPFAAIGIGSFGPLCLDRANGHFGHMENTPKPGWAGVDVHGHFARRFAVPVGIDTDVTGAALAEGVWGASTGCAVHAYATIGTGVGLGIVMDGKAVHGRLHPEAGHMRIRRTPGDGFSGACPAHGDCLEGLVGGPALAARAGRALADVPDDDSIWQRVAAELGEWVAMLILCLSPQRLVIGGGVLDHRPALLGRVRGAVADNLGGYLAGLDLAALQSLVVPPALGRDAGPLGAIVIGQSALRQARP
ncbi:ROK family protein [Sphingobium sp. HBC34]|uniref:fructokinase n=1 Tax=Sphingobium cyanobacteriorum TaxID=3063954 RepID=A0ABT8ZM71_9SPHN|nr:ROK family protein [Sphingobium sp. HBC34]MDO7835625.1 ROK family protein [Sphingobium sp. HBC34]